MKKLSKIDTNTTKPYPPTITADTINKMFIYLYQQSYFKDLLNTFLSSKDQKDEFRQFLSEKLLGKPQEDMLRLFNTGEMRFYLSKFFTNNIKSHKSQWYTINRKLTEQSTDFNSYKDKYELEDYLLTLNNQDLTNNINEHNPTAVLTTKEYSEQLISRIHNSIQVVLLKNPRLRPYLRLYNLYYVDKLTYREISKRTKVAYNTACDQIQLINKLVQEDLKSNIDTQYGN